MAKRDITTAYAEQHDITKRQATQEIDRFVAFLSQQLIAHGEVKLSGFGTFGTKVRAERQGVNPATQEEITIPERVVPFFRASQKLKASVAQD